MNLPFNCLKQSPVSASIELSTTANGADRSTLEETKSVLGFKNHSLEGQADKCITHVVDNMDPDAGLLLINVLHFKGIWTSKCDKRNTV
jgi:serine protease inhibitor